MEKSQNYGFNLPSRDTDDIADINEISQNFNIIDEKLFETSENVASLKKDAYEGKFSDDILHFLTYEIIDREVHITRCNIDISGNRIIPKFIDGYPVVSIDGFGYSDLTSIVIPDSVRSIGKDAFIDNISLTSVYIPDSVTSIERSAFASTSITDVYYGGSEEQWAEISVEDNNHSLLIGNIHYNQKPATIADVIQYAPVADQTYSPESENAQSGIAVSEALKTVNVDVSNYYTKEEIDALVGEMGKLPSVGNFIGEVIIDNDETRIIEFTECADGSPLDFDELFIVVEGGADTARVLAFTTNNEYNSSAYNWSVMSSLGLNTEKRYATLHCRMIGGRWIVLGYASNTSIYAANVQRSHTTTIQQGKQRCVNSLVIGLGWGHFTNGTKIAVYGR